MQKILYRICRVTVNLTVNIEYLLSEQNLTLTSGITAHLTNNLYEITSSYKNKSMLA